MPVLVFSQTKKFLNLQRGDCVTLTDVGNFYISGDTLYHVNSFDGVVQFVLLTPYINTDDQQLTISNDTVFLEDGGFVLLPSQLQNMTLGLKSGANIPVEISGGTGYTITQGSNVTIDRNSPTQLTINSIPDGQGVTSVATNNGITGGAITTTGTVGLTGQALALHNMATNGFFYRNGATIGARTIVAGTGISVANGNGASGNPTITNTSPNVNQTLSAGGTGSKNITISAGNTVNNVLVPSGGSINQILAKISSTTGDYSWITSPYLTGSGISPRVAYFSGAGTLTHSSGFEYVSGSQRMFTPNLTVGLTTTGPAKLYNWQATAGTSTQGIWTSNTSGDARMWVDVNGRANFSQVATTDRGITVGTSGQYIGIAESTPGKTLDVGGDARIQDLAPTGTTTAIVGSISDGTLKNIGIGSGLSLSSNTLTNTSVNTDNQGLTFSTKSGSDVPLAISGGSGVNFREGTGITLTRGASNQMTIASTGGIQNLSYGFKSGSNIPLDISGGTGTTITQGTNVTIDRNSANQITINSVQNLNSGAKIGDGVNINISNGSPVVLLANNTTQGLNITSNANDEIYFSLVGQSLALHTLGTNGLIARTGSGTVAGRTITAGTGITIANGDGVSGNPTITSTIPSDIGKTAVIEKTSSQDITSTGYASLSSCTDFNNLGTGYPVAKSGCLLDVERGRAYSVSVMVIVQGLGGSTDVHELAIRSPTATTGSGVNTDAELVHTWVGNTQKTLNLNHMAIIESSGIATNVAALSIRKIGSSPNIRILTVYFGMSLLR